MTSTRARTNRESRRPGFLSPQAVGVILISILCATVVLIAGQILFCQAEGAWKDDRRVRASDLSASIAQEVGTLIAEKQVGELTEACKSALVWPDVSYVVIFDQDGNVLAGGAQDGLLWQSLPSSLESDSLEGDSAQISEDLQGGRHVHAVALVGSRDQERPVEASGSVRVGVALDGFGTKLRALQKTTLWIALSMALLSLLPVMVIIRRMVAATIAPATHYINEMAKVDGDLRRIDLRGLAQLAKPLETVSNRLAESRGEVKQLNSDLQRRVEERVAKLQRTVRMLEKTAAVDHLTGLHNRRGFQELADTVFKEARRARLQVSCVMMDIDNFKQINDGLGHQAGDALLKFVGELVRATLREGDVAARYGGDEFILLLPGVEPEQTSLIVNRLRLLFSQHAVSYRYKDHMPSLSAGVASLEGVDCTDQLISAADKALYVAKRKGKNQVVAAGVRSA